ncbi:MAG: ATP-binding protein [Chitinophagales bacterium]|nr:ATP-binding protein [Chitinophagales bacterium]
MNTIIEFLSRLFGTESWPARWHCGEWTAFHGWLYIVSDILIATAYFAIPTIIIYYVIKRKQQLPFLQIFWLFGAFILACGATHLIDAMIFWVPVYRFSALVRFATAIVSLFTVWALIKNLPLAFSLRSTAELEAEVEQRKLIEKQLTQQYHELQEAQTIAKLGSFKWNLYENTVSCSNQTYVNLGIENTTKLDLDTFIGLVHPDDQPMARETMENSLQSGEGYSFTVKIIKQDTQACHIMLCKGETIKDKTGKPNLLIGTIQDITQQKETEIELAQKAKELERSNAELEMFAYAASHDLQEPLRKIRSFADRLSEGFHEVLGVKGLDYLERMNSASLRMQKLIEDLLNYSRLSKNKDDFEPTDMNTLVNEVVSDLEISIQQKQASIHTDSIPEIEVIPSQMRQLFTNLLSNALKFTDANVQPIISIQASEILYDTGLGSSQKCCKLVIKDNGIGFDEKFSDKIFILFQRLHGRSEYEGTGIGLALVKKIIDNHHGTIVANSTLGKGTTFTIILPISQPKTTINLAVTPAVALSA